MIPELIKLFNCVSVKADEKLLDPEKINLIAAKCGYFVVPAACTKDVMKFLESQQANYNTTFYESWEQVNSLEEAEMRILQLVHYLTTYGSDYTMRPFTMNDVPPEMRFTNFTFINACSEEELFHRIVNILESGIALKSDTVDLLIKQISIFNKEYGWSLNLEQINNREAKAKYCYSEKIFPYDGIELVRIMMIAVKGNALIINDSYTFGKIQENINELKGIFRRLDERHLKELSTVFYRFKRLFLVMRCSAIGLSGVKDVTAIVNKIRRLARKYHKPLSAGTLESLLNSPHSDENINKAINSEKSPFKLIRILNYLNSKSKEGNIRTYYIRNGKMWISAKGAKSQVDVKRINYIKESIISRLKNLLANNSLNPDGSRKTVKYPSVLELAAPVSEKMFVGSLPYGSRFKLGTNNYIGIYWRNEWGARDLDLWMIGTDGQRIGWAANHKDGNILFSGDMTDANPEATEILYCRGAWPDCAIKINRYNGQPGARYRLFFGRDEIDELPMGYMVNPDSILLSENLVSDLRETTIGIICDNEVYFASLSTGNMELPDLNNEKKLNFEEALRESFKNYITLREVLTSIGFVEYNESNTSLPDVDLSKNLSKDSIINIFKQ